MSSDSPLEDLMEWTDLTFKTIGGESFIDFFNELLQNVTEIRASDLDFNLETMEKFTEIAKEKSLAVSSIGIKETPTYSMDIFILQNGSRIPLHDHQNMHGIIKVVHGAVKITSYTAIPNNEIEIPEDIKSIKESKQTDLCVPVELHLSKTITTADEPCVLTPTKGNYHEICAVGGTAAIFDILAPPYGERNCNYYSAVETKISTSPCKVWLVKETSEPSFWCD